MDCGDAGGWSFPLESLRAGPLPAGYLMGPWVVVGAEGFVALGQLRGFPLCSRWGEDPGQPARSLVTVFEPLLATHTSLPL